MSPGSKSFVSVCPAAVDHGGAHASFQDERHSAAVALPVKLSHHTRLKVSSIRQRSPSRLAIVRQLFFSKLFPRTFPFDFSNSNLKVGNSFQPVKDPDVVFEN